jgi:hypothetical protein
MRKGLYRVERGLLGAVAYVDWGAAEGEPFLTRDLYIMNGYKPPFDELPTKEEFEARDA